jgi:uncharacterized lipoprotein YehR (DUF1307 family)
MVQEETPNPSTRYHVSGWRVIMKKLLTLFLVLLLALSLAGCGKKKEEVEEVPVEEQIEETYTEDVEDEADEWDESYESEESSDLELDLDDSSEEDESGYGLSVE